MSECSSAAMQDTAVIWQIAIINSRAEEESEELSRSGSKPSEKVTKGIRAMNDEVWYIVWCSYDKMISSAAILLAVYT